MQLVHPLGVEGRGGNQGFVALRRQNGAPPLNHVFQIELIKRHTVCFATDAFAAAVQPAAQDDHHRIALAADEIGGELVEIAGSDGCTDEGGLGAVELGKIGISNKKGAKAPRKPYPARL